MPALRKMSTIGSPFSTLAVRSSAKVAKFLSENSILTLNSASTHSRHSCWEPPST